ncbi:hypothetical protein GGI02_003998, partial [Coemansia sp. RSA 2322]
TCRSMRQRFCSWPRRAALRSWAWQVSWAALTLASCLTPWSSTWPPQTRLCPQSKPRRPCATRKTSTTRGACASSSLSFWPTTETFLASTSPEISSTLH